MEKNQMKKSSMKKQPFDEYGYYGENNGPIDEWIKRNRVDDPCDEMLPMSKPSDKDYTC